MIDVMVSDDLRKKHEDLCDEIEKHNRAYYVDAEPLISDYEYDRLYQELVKLEGNCPELTAPNSPTQRVGAKPVSEFPSYTHMPPMRSLDNVYSDEELMEFFKRVEKGLLGEKIEYVVEPKVDGVAVALRYENGLLTAGGTRGDGVEGDDITQNLKTLKQVPLKIYDGPPFLEVRGEVFMGFEGFEKLNKNREEAGEPLFANPRNATAGTLKLLDSREVVKRPLRIVLYTVGKVRGDTFLSQMDTLKKLRDYGFPSFKWYKKCGSPDEALDAIKTLEQFQKSFDFPTDGAVIKVNDLAQREILKSTAKAPRWAIAYKFSPEQAEARLLQAIPQVGRTGAITPVAILEPVQLSGTTVSRATLHNYTEIARKDIRIGDVVIVQKAGEIIPEIVRVNFKKRNNRVQKIQSPEVCPSCNGPLVQEDVLLRCENDDCLDKIKRRLHHFAQRGAMDIEGMGGVLVDQLVDKGLVRMIGQIYELKPVEVAALERMGAKSAENLFQGIEASRRRALWRLIFGLGILHVGAGVARKLAEAFPLLDDLVAASEEELCEVPDIGEVVAKSIYQFFREEENQRLIEALRRHGLNFKGEKIEERGRGALSGKKFVLTGTLSKPRNDFEERIRLLGGEIANFVSAKTDFVLAGESAGSKLKKARELKIPILSEKEFEKLIQNF